MTRRTRHTLHIAAKTFTYAAVALALSLLVGVAHASAAPASPNAWFTQAIYGSAVQASPSAPGGTIDGCTPVIKEVIEQCNVAWAGLPAVVRVARLGNVAVVYAPTRPGWYVLRYRSCANIGGYNGQPFKLLCHW